MVQTIHYIQADTHLTTNFAWREIIVKLVRIIIVLDSMTGKESPLSSLPFLISTIRRRVLWLRNQVYLINHNTSPIYVYMPLIIIYNVTECVLYYNRYLPNLDPLSKYMYFDTYVQIFNQWNDLNYLFVRTH